LGRSSGCHSTFIFTDFGERAKWEAYKSSGSGWIAAI
jgi:hypothetical protein